MRADISALKIPEWQQQINGKTLILILGALALVFTLAFLLPPAVDWQIAFRPAALELLAGRTPYSVAGFFNPPWALLPLLPLALLPEAVGRSLLVLLTLGSYAFVARRLGGRLVTIALLLLSPPAMHEVLNGNLDWLAVLGFVLPPQIGLFFVFIKPQIGIGVALFWLYCAWREGGFRQVSETFLPVMSLTLLSFLLFGFWPLRSQAEIELWWNASLWPLSIPLGLGLLILAMRNTKLGHAISAAPLLSPYVLLHSWVGVLFAIVHRLSWSLAAFSGLWLLVALRWLGYTIF